MAIYRPALPLLAGLDAVLETAVAARALAEATVVMNAERKIAPTGTARRDAFTRALSNRLCPLSPVAWLSLASPLSATIGTWLTRSNSKRGTWHPVSKTGQHVDERPTSPG